MLFNTKEAYHKQSKYRMSIMNFISVAFLILQITASLYMHGVLCENLMNLSNRTYDMVKGSLIDEDHEVFVNSEISESMPLCALKCLYSGCRIWVYGNNSQQCLMLSEYKEIFITSSGDPSDLAWSNVYAGAFLMSQFILHVILKVNV